MRIAVLQQKTPSVAPEQTLETFSEIIKRYNPELLIAAEYLFIAPIGEGWDYGRKEPTFTPRIFDEKEKKSLEIELQKLTKGSETLLIPGTVIWAEQNNYRNSCPVFHGGRKIKDIQKEFANSSDSHYAPAGVHIDYYNTFLLTSPLTHPAYISRHIFSCRDKKYLIEICDDHPSQARRRGIDDPLPPIADVQIIISNSIYHHFATPRSALFAKNGGLVIECNGYYPTSFIGKIGERKVETVYRSTQPAKEKIQVIDV